MKFDRSQLEEKLREYAQRAVAFDQQIEIAEVKFEGPDENLLASVLIWHPNKIDLDLCEKVSQLLNEIIDQDDPFPEHYTLEVSSLSLTRKLKTTDDFRRACSETIRIKFREKTRAEEIGVLTDWAADQITIEKNKKKIQIPLAEIKHAVIEF